MKIFRIFLFIGMGSLVIGAWARSPAEPDANVDPDAIAAHRLSEQRRADLRAALKASKDRDWVGLQSPQEVRDPVPALSDEERAQRRQQLRQQLRAIRD